MEADKKMKLETPFDRNVVKTRRGPNGTMLSYVPVAEYVRRLNEVFGAEWSFEIVRRDLIEDQIVVEGRLTVGHNVKCGIGGAAVTRRQGDGAFVSLADDFKSAGSDALKRCCRLLGIGLELYAEESAETDERARGPEHSPPADSHPNRSSRERSGRITAGQLKKLEELTAELELDWRSFRDSVRQRHEINVEYADKRLASQLIGELIGQVRKLRNNGTGGRGGEERRTW